MQLANYSTEPGRIERRRSPRIPVGIPIELRVEGSNVPMRTETSDLSLGGCYVEMYPTLDRGTLLYIILWLGEGKIVAKGVVVTCHPQFGNGIEFIAMTNADRERLDSFLDATGQAAGPKSSDCPMRVPS